jgi:hypothetical protein
MSRARSLSTDISVDPRVAELAEYGPLALLLYTWAIPHADDWGRLTGDARQFKLLVCPALDITAKDVDTALEQIAASGLWTRYEADGRMCIAFPIATWWKRQTYISRDKRQKDRSKYPAPPDFTLPTGTDCHNADDVEGESQQNATECHEVPQIVTKPKPSPTPTPKPKPSPTPSAITTPLTDRPDTGGPGEKSRQDTAAPCRPSVVSVRERKKVQEAFIAETLTRHPRWGPVLEQRRKASRTPIDSIPGWKAGTLQNWLDGDGTPTTEEEDAAIEAAEASRHGAGSSSQRNGSNGSSGGNDRRATAPVGRTASAGTGHRDDGRESAYPTAAEILERKRDQRLLQGGSAGGDTGSSISGNSVPAVSANGAKPH